MAHTDTLCSKLMLAQIWFLILLLQHIVGWSIPQNLLTVSERKKQIISSENDVLNVVIITLYGWVIKLF